MESLKVIVPNQIRVEIRWRTITASDKADWPFRENATLKQILLDETRRGAQIYRFRFHEPYTSCYIGECELFEDRVRDYFRDYFNLLKSVRADRPASGSIIERWKLAIKKQNKHSTIRVSAMIQTAEQDGTKVELQLLDFSEFAINKIEISPGLLTNPFCRRAMENLAILDAQTLRLQILNRGEDTREKDFRDRLKRFANSSSVQAKNRSRARPLA